MSRRVVRVRPGTGGLYYATSDEPDGWFVPWPEDCPWDIDSFPLPGETVKHDERGEVIVRGEPYLQGATLWCVMIEHNGYRLPAQCQKIPAIWNARKDAEPEVVGTLEVREDGYYTWGGGSWGNLGPGKYIITKAEEDE